MIEVTGSYQVTRRGRAPKGAARLSEHLDHVMSELVDLDGVLDAAIDADVKAGIVTFTVTMDGDDLDDGCTRGIAAIRTAIHGAGGGTPGWDERNLRETAQKAELINS